METGNEEHLFNDISLLRQGDREAFERIYKQWWAKVYNFSALYFKDKADQEDVVQKVFIKLWKIRERLEPEIGLDGLLFIMTRNMVFSEIRHNKKQATVSSEEIPDLMQAASEIEADIEAEDLRLYVDKLVKILPPRQRQTYLLSRKSGLSHTEISEVMGISERGVERNIYLALKFIKENLPLLIIFLV